MSSKNYVEEIIDRYVYQVVRRMPRKSQKDIERELRTLIDDMLEERCGELPRTKKDVEVVLTELGAPGELAAQYRDAPKRYLIGPDLFPKYWFLLKILLLAVGIGMSIASVVMVFINPSEWWFVSLARWFANTLISLVGIFSGLTIVFAVFEWRGISMEQFEPGLHLEDLPPVPVKKARISRGESIASIVFTVLFILLFTAVPQLMSVYTRAGAIPIFDLEQLRRMLPLFLLSFGCGLLRDSFGLVEGRYTVRFALVTTVCNVLSALFCLLIFQQPIWNPAFMAQLGEAFDFGGGLPFLMQFWSYFQRYFVVVLLVAFVLDLGTAWFRALRYGKAEQAEE